jgi:hypothetical protein
MTEPDPEPKIKAGSVLRLKMPIHDLDDILTISLAATSMS